MRSFASRRGSALLVVLGMLAFMVVSAVAFSAYMRRARLPSNYLRRATSSRELVKAALARAIDDIDHAVNDNPHPGLGTQKCNHRDENTGTSNTNRNGWVGRVFMNTDMSNNSTTKDNAPNGAADPNDTVSVLSLEGLAYVPAPLQGEARYYSRRTPTAEWHSFDFDAGRYAYFALDVSDYFDVNRMFANEPRSSAANTRITLSYLFENGNGGTWDSFLKSGTPAVRSVDDDLNISFSGSCVPLTSVADMNLLLGSSSCGSFKSWFYEYYNKGGKVDVGSKPNDDKNPRLMPLITDACFITNDVFKTSEAYSATWSGNGQAGTDPYNLADASSQPFNFKKDWSEETPINIDDIFNDYRENNLWYKHLSLVGMCALCDYLDPDRIPTSLSIPTLERVPMICGFKLQNAMAGTFGLKREPETDNNIVVKYNDTVVTPNDNPPKQQGETRVVTATVVYRLGLDNFMPNGKLQVASIFPFAHKDEKDTSGWQIDGRFSLFFTDITSGAMKLRTDDAESVLHLSNKDVPEIQASELTSDGVFNAKMTGGAPTFTVPDDIYKCSTLSIDGSEPLDALLKTDFLTVVYKWEQTAKIDRSNILEEPTLKWAPWFSDDIKNDETKRTITLGLPILGNNGLVKHAKDRKWTGNPDIANLQLNAAVWMRVKDSQNRVVDMVPACPDDDNAQLRGKDGLSVNIIRFRGKFGAPYPLMLLGVTLTGDNGETALKLDSVSALDNYCSTGLKFTIPAEAFYSPDPRFNYAPESWIKDTGGDVASLTDWQAKNNNAFGDSGKDIYFATSDAGYLQSPYELSNLPWLTNLTPNYGGNDANSYLEEPGNKSAIATVINSACNYKYFWRNYKLWKRNAPAYNDDNPISVESNLLFHTSYQGQRVNPYSDNMEVIRAVFANTPLDWKRASTSTVYSASSECAGDFFGAASSFSKYTWSDSSQESNAKTTREELERFAKEFIKEVNEEYKNEDPETWDVVLADLMSDDQTNYLGGESLSSAKLYKSDRDFLYGYWRDCFAARQQLYLIFVRAEPLMLGGSSPGATPPQLGGRAVALVWRDPTAVGNKGSSECSGYPHPTRVLFYKNLE